MFTDIRLYLDLFEFGYISEAELSYALFMHDPKARAYIMWVWINIYRKDFNRFFSWNK